VDGTAEDRGACTDDPLRERDEAAATHALIFAAVMR
jgi:hypothetical protein